MKRLKPKQIKIIAAAALLVIVAGAVAWAWRSAGQRQVTHTPRPSIVPGNSTHDEPSSSPSPTPQPTGSSAPTSSPSNGSAAPIAKPSLQKSSGNAPGSSVPAGATIEFTCEGTAGLGCEVILTDRNNSAHVINLGKKAITSNGRGQNFAIWDWPAVSGSWNVVARASDTAGNSATSDAQILEVK